MKKSNLLLNREIHNVCEKVGVRTWHAPRNFLESFKSVVCVEVVDTTSSAGDWSGFFVQKLYGKYHVIRFEQENNYPSDGFTLRTDEKVTMNLKTFNGCSTDVEYITNCLYHE